MLFDERVRQYEFKLNDTDDQVIEYILKNKEEVTRLSIQALASRLFTVPNTITRLSKKLGYDGFAQLKNSLKEEIHQAQEVQEDHEHESIFKTFHLIDKEKLSMVTGMLQEAKRVLFFAVGDTAPFCEMMVKDLRVVGKHAEFYLHRHEMVYELNQMTEEDLLFLISLTGETSQVLEIAELAKNKGIKIISLTHFSKNSLQQAADVSLYCFAPKKMLNGYNVTDRTTVMIVLRALSECFWELEGHRV